VDRAGDRGGVAADLGAVAVEQAAAGRGVDDVDAGSTPPTRSGSSSAPGTYGIPALVIFFLARVIRAATVASVVTYAAATSAVDSPHSIRKVSATRASGASAG
jgi:hypothetical protein